MFTDAQKASIRQYLGFSQLFFLIDPRLESQLNDLPVSVPDAVPIVVDLLTQLAAIDAALAGNLTHLILSKAEDVTFRAREEYEDLRDQGRNLIHRMSIIFQINCPRDYYSIGQFDDNHIQMG